MLNSVHIRIQWCNKNLPLSAPLRPLGSTRQIYVSEGRGFRIPHLSIPGRGTLGVTLDRVITVTERLLHGDTSVEE